MIWKIISLLFIAQVAFSQKCIIGNVSDDTGEPLIIADVVLYHNGKLLTGIQTDFEGNFIIDNLAEYGLNFELVVSYIGFKSKIISIDFNSIDTIVVEEVLNVKGVVVEMDIGDYKVPVIDFSYMRSGFLTSDKIKRLPIKVNRLPLSGTSGISIQLYRKMNVKECKKRSINSYLDGMRVN